MAPQSLTTPLLLIAACIAAVVYAPAEDAEIWFALCSFCLAVAAFELRQTVLFNKDAERVRAREMGQAE